MLPVQIGTADIYAEIERLRANLVAGAANLAKMEALSSGVTAHEVVMQRDKSKLLHYKSLNNNPSNPPLLIVYSLVNRPYMADLQEGRSLVEGLLRAGADVYLLDWGYPDISDRFVALDDYLNHDLDASVNEICLRHGVAQLNLLGICQGGVFSLCYSALHPQKVRNLVTMVTPVDFHTPDNTLSLWTKHIDIDQLVDTFGNIPGQLLNAGFMQLKPYRSVHKYLSLTDVMHDELQLRDFMQMEHWLFDCPDQAGAAFRQFAKEFIQQNKLLSGEILIGSRAVDLRNITMPVLNVYAEHDHLVPPAAAKALAGATASNDYSELVFSSGHIGLFVSRKAQKVIPPAIGKWLATH